MDVTSGSLPEDVPLKSFALRVGEDKVGEVHLAGLEERDPVPEEVLGDLADFLALALHNARLYEQLRGHYLAGLQGVAAAVEVRDPYTRGHAIRVARMVEIMAHELALSESLAEEAYMAALLHDLGKVAVPQEILLKPGPLADEEREEIRQHPVLGVMILQPAGFPPGVLVAIRHHHEDYDGGGYPDGLRGEEIPLAARLIRVADAFDAMTSARPYREPMAPEEALRELRRGAGRQFDPVLVELFLRLRERDRAVPPAVERPGTLLSLLVEVLAGLAVGRP